MCKFCGSLLKLGHLFLRGPLHLHRYLNLLHIIFYVCAPVRFFHLWHLLELEPLDDIDFLPAFPHLPGALGYIPSSLGQEQPAVDFEAGVVEDLHEGELVGGHGITREDVLPNLHLLLYLI